MSGPDELSMVIGSSSSTVACTLIGPLTLKLCCEYVPTKLALPMRWRGCRVRRPVNDGGAIFLVMINRYRGLLLGGCHLAPWLETWYGAHLFLDYLWEIVCNESHVCIYVYSNVHICTYMCVYT